MSKMLPSDRSRSPRFPSYTLEQSIGYVKKIYDAVHRSSIDSVTAMQLMGFAGKSGASSTALGSLRQFGLIEGMADKTRISDLALKILEPIDDIERAEAISSAAREPSAFNQILDRFNGRLPNANEPIRAFLIRDLGFSKSGADDCLNSIRSTLQFAENIPNSSPSSISESFVEFRSGSENLQQASAEPHTTAPTGSELSDAGEILAIPLTKDCKATIRFEGNVSEKAIANLLRHIELMKDVWSED